MCPAKIERLVVSMMLPTLWARITACPVVLNAREERVFRLTRSKAD
jgi:hypothetical protein